MREVQSNPSSYSHSRLPASISTYLLQDYTFLNQYTLIDSPINTQTQFLARINSTHQLVKFIKKPLLPTNTIKGLNMYKRFQAMFTLFQKGLILADNMFILEEGQGKYFYYVIEPYLNVSDSQIQMPFVILQQYLVENRNNMAGFESRKALFIKCKNLFDNLLQSGQAYCGLNSRKIVIDDEGNTFLLPFNLQFNISNKPYQRSYYPLEVLKYLSTQNQKQPLKSLQKWDIWSFGCITAEIFLYLTPFFISTSVDRQIHRIQTESQQIFVDFRTQFMNVQQNIIEVNTESECSINQHLSSAKEEIGKIMNFFVNVFNSDENCRLISFESNQNENEFSEKFIRLKSTRRSVGKHSKRQAVKNINLSNRLDQKEHPKTVQDNFKELNLYQLIHQEKEEEEQLLKQTFDFELKFKSFLLFKSEEYIKEKEIQILLEFCNGEKFKFFIDLPSDLQNMEWIEIKLDKKITFLKKSFEFAQSLLEDQIVATIEPTIVKTSDQNKNSQIFINLSAFLIKNDEGTRMWKKPIRGSYATQSQSFMNCKMKIQAQLIETKDSKSQQNRRSRKLSIQSSQQVYSKRSEIEQPQQTSRFPTHNLLKEDNNVLKPSQQIQFNELNADKINSSQKPKIQLQKNFQSLISQTLQNRVKKLIRQSKPKLNLMKQKDLSSKLKKLLIR